MIRQRARLALPWILLAACAPTIACGSAPTETDPSSSDQGLAPICDLHARAAELLGPGRPCPPSWCRLDLEAGLLSCFELAQPADGRACTRFVPDPLEGGLCGELCAPASCEPDPAGRLRCTEECGVDEESRPRTCYLVGTECTGS